MSRLRRFFLALATVVASTVLTLLALEGVFRLFVPPPPVILVAPEPAVLPSRVDRGDGQSLGKIEVATPVTLFYETTRGVRMRPNTDAFLREWGWEGNVHIRSNSLGVRHAELPPKGSDEFRILVLGDSIVFGAELDEPLTFTALMERHLANRRQRVVVVNAAIPSSNTRDQLYRFLELRESVRPDLVLVGMYLNDAQINTTYRIWTLAEPWRSSRLLTWAVRRTALTPWLGESSVRRMEPQGPEHVEFWRRFAAGRTMPSDYGIPYAPRTREEMDTVFYNARDDFGLALEPASWNRLAPVVASFRVRTAADGVKLRIALFPVRWQVEAEFLEDRAQRMFEQMCADQGVRCLDLLPAMRRWHAEGKAIHFDGCHLLKDGHAEVARAFEEWLDGLGDLPGPS